MSSRLESHFCVLLTEHVPNVLADHPKQDLRLKKYLPVSGTQIHISVENMYSKFRADYEQSVLCTISPFRALPIQINVKEIDHAKGGFTLP